jgi:ABC-type uncharacterized transport system involved in gliding motility auxiliary subunit
MFYRFLLQQDAAAKYVFHVSEICIGQTKINFTFKLLFKNIEQIILFVSSGSNYSINFHYYPTSKSELREYFPLVAEVKAFLHASCRSGFYANKRAMRKVTFLICKTG